MFLRNRLEIEFSWKHISQLHPHIFLELNPLLDRMARTFYLTLVFFGNGIKSTLSNQKFDSLQLSGFSIVGSKFISIVRRARMVSTGDNEI
jgi:hypothetical protein